MDKILVIGAAGQIGSELVVELRKIYGNEHVYATDIKQAPPDVAGDGPFHIPGLVGILHPENKDSPVLPGKQVIEKGSA